MITGLAHIGIAVADLETAVELWTKVTGARLLHRQVVSDQKVNVAVISVGELRIELLSASAPDSPIAKFIAARGPGIHHLALRSTSARQELDRLRSQGVRLIDERARDGAENCRVAFVHPKALDGVLLEIVEYPES
jgi:methylmalonyl-CoA/ethylmalonyl-CoA epimerase